MALYDVNGNPILTMQYEPMDGDIPTIIITGTIPPKSQGEGNVTIEYTSKTENFTAYGTAKVQGNTSAQYAKKNLTLKLYSDAERTIKLKKKFKDWDKARSKFVIKANWIDHTHARNVVTARIWTKIMKSRADFSTLPTALKGANLAIDGFPVIVYLNGSYAGLYTWNLPKDAMYGLDDNTDSNAIIQSEGEVGGSNIWRASTNSDEKWSDEIHDEMPSVIINGFNTLLNFVYTSSDTDFVNNLETYFDKQSLIDQYILLYVACIVDNIVKNQTFFTYNGTYYYGGMYDLDGTWGLPPVPSPAADGTGWLAATTAFQSGYIGTSTSATTNLLYERIESLFDADIKSRYKDLRGSVLLEDNIVKEFEKFINSIPSELYPQDYTRAGQTGIPYKYDGNISQIKEFITNRLAYVDSKILI